MTARSKTTAMQTAAIVVVMRTLDGWSRTKAISDRTPWSALTAVQRLRQAEGLRLVEARRAGQSIEWRLLPDVAHAHAFDFDWDDDWWCCSCGEDDQPTGATFWDCDEVTCCRCGAVFDLELDGDTEGGFSKWPSPVVER